MKLHRIGSLALALGAALPGTVHALDNAFSYQGVLADGGQPANGAYDFSFALVSATGTPLAAPIFLDDVPVANGSFDVALAFGHAFGPVDAELEVSVRAGASTGAFTTLVPRQRIRPAPYAQYAERVANGAVGNAQLAIGAVGTTEIANNAILSTDIADGVVTGTDLAPGTVTGNNLAIDTITASDIANGAVTAQELAPGAVLSANLADGAVTSAKVSASGSTAGQVLGSTGTGAAWVTPRPRRFYLAKVIASGANADTLCGAGFHFASIFELVDVGALRYDTTLGQTTADSGAGPPTSAGWARSGAGSGPTNCNTWTDATAAVTGTLTQLSRDPASQELGPWSVASGACSTLAPSWCVED